MSEVSFSSWVKLFLSVIELRFMVLKSWGTIYDCIKEETWLVIVLDMLIEFIKKFNKNSLFKIRSKVNL